MSENAANAKKKKSLAGILLVAGFLFLCNPLYACVDVLPDTIGWALLWFAVRPYAVRNDNFARAGKWALINGGISLLRIFFMFVFPLSGFPSNVMMATAVMSVADILGMILFFSVFYKGFEEMSRYAEREDLYLKSDNDKFLSILFAIGRSLFAFLPELTATASLFVSHYGPDDLNTKDPEATFELIRQIGDSRSLFWILFAVFEIILAVVWLVHVLPRLYRFASDSGVLGRAKEEMTEEEISASGRDRTGAGWLTAAKFMTGFAALCCLDLQADGFRFLPFALFPAAMVLVCLFLDRFRKIQHQEPLFRRSAILFGACAVVLLGFEFYRRFATVWDGRAFEETEVWQLCVSAGWLILVFFGLFVVWNLFSGEAERLSEPYHGVGGLHLNGLPFAFLVLVCGLHVVCCALPALDRILTAPRVVAIALFAFVLFRRMSMLEEQIRLRLSEEPAEPGHGKE